MINLPPVVSTPYVCPNPIPAHIKLDLTPGSPITVIYDGDPNDSSKFTVDSKGEIQLVLLHCYQIYFRIASDTTGMNLHFDPKNLLGGDTEFQSPQFDPSNSLVFSTFYTNNTCQWYWPFSCSHPYTVSVFDKTKPYPLDPHVHNSPPSRNLFGFGVLLALLLFDGVGLLRLRKSRQPSKSPTPPADPSDNGEPSG